MNANIIPPRAMKLFRLKIMFGRGKMIVPRIIKCQDKPVIMKSTDNTSVISLCLACYKNGKINRADACIVVSEGK